MAENVPSSGTYAYGGWPDVDELYQKQLTETDPEKRGAMLAEIQKILHERVRFAPIYDYFWASGIGPRVEDPALMKIDPFPWAAPLEEVKLKRAVTGPRAVAEIPIEQKRRRSEMSDTGGRNTRGKPVAVVIGATSKWQAEGRNTLLAHGKPVDDSELPVGVRWGVGGAIAQKFAKEGFFTVVTTRNAANAAGLGERDAGAGRRVRDRRA